MPLIFDIFNQLSKVVYFTKFNLRLGYWQAQIAEGDESKSTCVTWYGY
jgi:hypothetical protein